jgi:hypothetical protein
MLDMETQMEGIIESILISGSAGGEVVSQSSVKLEIGRGIVGDRYYLSKGTYSKKLEKTYDFEITLIEREDLSKGTYSKKLEKTYDFEITLIEREEIDVFNQATGLNYDAAAFRRNLVTRGIRLNDLVGKEFSIGDVKFRGVRLCEPCAYLSDLLGPKFMSLMMHKAGLRAQILVNGSIEASDSICG